VGWLPYREAYPHPYAPYEPRVTSTQTPITKPINITTIKTTNPKSKKVEGDWHFQTIPTILWVFS